MIAKILVLTDLHKRYKDSQSVKGQIAVQNKIQQDIIDFNIRNNITHNIIAGDWYDRGFHGLGQAYGAIEMDRRLSESVNGNVFLCIGNHFYLERDENPEMYIIQPNDTWKPQTPIPLPDKPIFQAVPKLNIGPVQISMFHFNKINKNYTAYRDPDCQFHIGIYHDDAVVPGWVREQEGFVGSSSQNYLDGIYANIDLAIHGHIHTKIGSTSLTVNGNHKVPMFIPGSLGIVSNKEQHKHVEVQLPVIVIEDDYSVKIKLAPFSTHIDELKFYTPKRKDKSILTTDANAKGEVHLMSNNASLQSLPVYLTKKGYELKHLNLVNSAIADTLSLSSAIGILAEVNQINEQSECTTTDSGTSE